MAIIDLDPDYELPDQPERPDLVPVFLGLFLLILAFFILLVSISTFEKVKSSAVMDSLTSTFTTVLPPTSNPNEFNAKDGDVIAAEAFQQEVTQLFSTAIQVEKIEVVQPGRLMRVQMAAGTLFVEGEGDVREDKTPFLDQIIAVLSNRPPGLRQDMEIIFGTEPAEGYALPVEQTLEVRRAGALARAMLERGAPPDAVSVGIKPGEVDQISMWFWIRGVEETEDRFEGALEDLRKRSGADVPEPGLEIQ